MDPYEEFLRRESERYEAEKKMPHCDDCGEPIGDDYYYKIGGVIYCEKCLAEYRRPTEDYINEHTV